MLLLISQQQQQQQKKHITCGKQWPPGIYFLDFVFHAETSMCVCQKQRETNKVDGDGEKGWGKE